MKATVLFTLIAGSTILMLYLNMQMRTEGMTHDALLMIPQRLSNFTVLASNMEVKKNDIPDWISCPPAVI